MFKRVASVLIAAVMLAGVLTGCVAGNSGYEIVDIDAAGGTHSGTPWDAAETASLESPYPTAVSAASETAVFTTEPIVTAALTEKASPVPESYIIDMESERGYVNANGVNLREKPDKSSKKLAKLYLGNKVTVTGQNDEWYRVKAGELTGYIAKQFVTFGSYETPAPTAVPSDYIENMKPAQGYVNANGVNLREKPDRSSKKLAKLYLGNKVTVTGQNDEWYRVEAGDLQGYIAKQFVTLGTYSTPKPTKTPKPTATPTPKPTKTPKPTATPTPKPSYYTISPGQFSDEDVYLLAQFLHYETRYNSVKGQRAVASVVLNRVLNESNHFPNTIRGVLFQHNQFVDESVLEGIVPNAEVLASARYVLQEHGPTLPKKVLFYRAASLGTSWYDYMTYYCTIDDNSFFIAIMYF